MSRNVFFSPGKANNFYPPPQIQDARTFENKSNPFSDVRAYKPATSEVFDKSKPFSELKQKLHSDSSLISLAKPQIKESFTQIQKPGLYKTPERGYPNKSPQFNGKLQPIVDSRFQKLNPQSSNNRNYFESSKKNLSPEPISENSLIEGLHSNQVSYLNKIKQLERVQEMRQKAFEGSVLNSTKAKNDQLDSLIEKRIKEKNQIDERIEAEKKAKVMQQKMELKTFIKDQISENPKNAEYEKKQDPDSWERLKLIEDMRKKQAKVPEKAENGGLFEQNTMKFFGCDVEENELPGSSTFKYDKDPNKLSPVRFGKTNIRNTTYNPITDSVNVYDNARNNVKALGSRKAEDLPSKVNELSPPKNSEFFSSRNKGYEITNPLTGEVKKVQKMMVAGNDDSSRFRFVIK